MNASRLVKIALGHGDAQNGNFSKEDSNQAAVNALIKDLGIDPQNITARNLRQHQSAIFAIIEEAIDEVLPQNLKEVMGQFAEIKQLQRNEASEFYIKTLNSSRTRLKQAIKRGARGGIYSARRLDGQIFRVDTYNYTVGFMVSLEQLLLGTASISDGFTLILEGIQEIIYDEIYNQLQGLHTGTVTPASHKVTGAWNQANMDGLIKIAKAYGQPTIFGFLDGLSNIENSIASDVFPDADKSDYRQMGRVGSYKGTAVVELPNMLTGYTATGQPEWAYNGNMLYIMPSDKKPVKVTLRGEGYLAEVDQSHGAKEIHFHKMIGTGVVLANNVCTYNTTV